MAGKRFKFDRNLASKLKFDVNITRTGRRKSSSVDSDSHCSAAKKQH